MYYLNTRTHQPDEMFRRDLRAPGPICDTGLSMTSKPLWALLVCLSPALAQNYDLPDKETLYYNIEWRLITAGRAKVQWLPLSNGGRQVNLHLESAGLVSKLYKVEDDYSADLNPGLCAQLAQMSAHEGSRNREIEFFW